MVTGIFLLRSIFTDNQSLAEVSNSNQAPRLGIYLLEVNLLPVTWSVSEVKYTPGDLTS